MTSKFRLAAEVAWLMPSSIKRKLMRDCSSFLSTSVTWLSEETKTWPLGSAALAHSVRKGWLKSTQEFESAEGNTPDAGVSIIGIKHEMATISGQL